MTRHLKYSSSSHGALAENGQHCFAARFALNHYQSNSIYSFIPKNGCTTMRYSLALANGCIQVQADFKWIHLNNRSFSASLRELACANYCFVILRCPYARLASAFVDKIVPLKGSGRSHHLSNFIKISGYPVNDIDKLTFRLFCQALAKPKVLRGDIHWRPQLDYLVYQDYDDYFRLEQFNEAIPEIERRTGITLHDARNLSRHGTDQLTLITEGCYADTPMATLSEMKTTGVMPTHGGLYDNALRQQIGQIFAMDFELLKAKAPLVSISQAENLHG